MVLLYDAWIVRWVFFLSLIHSYQWLTQHSALCIISTAAEKARSQSLWFFPLESKIHTAAQWHEWLRCLNTNVSWCYYWIGCMLCFSGSIYVHERRKREKREKRQDVILCGHFVLPEQRQTSMENTDLTVSRSDFAFICCWWCCCLCSRPRRTATDPMMPIVVQ